LGETVIIPRKAQGLEGNHKAFNINDIIQVDQPLKMIVLNLCTINILPEI